MKNKHGSEDAQPEYNALHHILNKYGIVMPIKEMGEQSPCCIKFLQELLKANATSSEEEILSMTRENHDTNEVSVEGKFDGEVCFTLPTEVNGEYIM